MKKLPIGVFDSGLGGLTALAELKRLLPNEDIIYFGDNARIPYGTKSPEIIGKFALQDTRFLLSKGIKAILVACGTVSSNCLAEVAETAKLPVVGVINSSAKKAAEIAKEGGGRVLVLGTGATVKSRAYEKALSQKGITEIYSRACPMFVPLVESWHPSVEDGATNAIVSEYLSDFAEDNPDSAILGCTHYPLLAEIIQKYLPETKLVSSGECAANEIKGILESKGLLNDEGGRIEFYTSGGAELFRENASMFLKRDITEDVKRVDIEEF